MDFYVKREMRLSSCVDLQAGKMSVDSLGTCGFMSIGETPARRARSACMSFEGKAQDRKRPVLWRSAES